MLAVVTLVGILGPSVTAPRAADRVLVGWLLVEVWLLPRTATGIECPAVGEAAQDATRSVAIQAVVRDVVTERAEAALEKELRQNLGGDAPSKDIQNPACRTPAGTAPAKPTGPAPGSLPSLPALPSAEESVEVRYTIAGDPASREPSNGIEPVTIAGRAGSLDRSLSDSCVVQVATTTRSPSKHKTVNASRSSA